MLALGLYIRWAYKQASRNVEDSPSNINILLFFIGGGIVFIIIGLMDVFKL